MPADDLITIDPDAFGGTPVFKGTPVPVKTLFDYLTADEFEGVGKTAVSGSLYTKRRDDL